MTAKYARDCLQLCKTKKGCQWSSHDRFAKICFLFSNCNHVDDTYSNFTTSEINCKQKHGKLYLELIVMAGDGR